MRVFAKFLKFLIALALIPLVAGEAWTFFDLARAVPAGQWGEARVISFAAGFITWLIVFIFLPRTMWLYVLGHEFTHAIFSMLAGGKVSSFQVSSKGGHVMTDKVNWWIALSPYFIPIYVLIWISLWVTINFYYPLKAWEPILYFGIGLFWSFHVTFTGSMIHFQQTDLTREGFIFSAVIISMINLLFVLLLLSLLTHDMVTAGHRFLHRTGECYIFTGNEIMRGVNWAWAAVHSRLGA